MLQLWCSCASSRRNCENYKRPFAVSPLPGSLLRLYSRVFKRRRRLSSSSFPPLAQSELWETSRPISSGIQREQSHYRLMRRRGIEGFILMTVMCVCKRAACTCFQTSLFVPAWKSQRGQLICGFRCISGMMAIIRSWLHLPLSVL